MVAFNDIIFIEALTSIKPVQLRVVDAAGRVVEQRQNIALNETLSVGAAYKPGVYYAETVQDGQHRLVKLVKEGQ